MDNKEEIKNFYKKYLLEPHSFENGRNLLKSCAQWIINQPHKASEQKLKRILAFPDGLQEDLNEPFIRVIDFYKKYEVCYPNYISTLFKKDPNFYKWCGRMVNTKYEIQSWKALNYLALYGSTILKKKAKAVLEKRNKEETCLKIVPMMQQQELSNLGKHTSS